MWLASEYDWPFLEHRWDLACPIGSRFLVLPTQTSAAGEVVQETVAINFERPVCVEVFYNNRWMELNYGIDSKEFNYLNSDLAGQVLDPVQRWRFATDVDEVSNANKIEVWPVNTVAQTIRFTGQRTLQALAADTDKADLDDMLLALSCSTEWLEKRESPEAKTKGALASARLVRLRGVYPERSRKIVLGGRDYSDGQRRRVVPITIIHG